MARNISPVSLFLAVCKDFVFLDHKLHVSFHEIPIQVMG